MTRVSWKIGLAVALALTASYGWAQTLGTLRGEVLDQSGKPVEGATVVLERTGGPDSGGPKTFELKTDKKGNYARMGVPIGEYRIIVEKAGVGAGAVADFRVPPGTRPVDVPTIKLAPQKTSGAAITETVQADFKRAADLVKQEKLDEAEKIYKGILEKFPGQAQVLLNLAIVSNRKKDVVAAESYYRQAIEAKPDNAEAYVGLSNVLVTNGQKDQAVEVLTKATADLPDSSELQYQMGWLLFNGGRSSDAEAYLMKAESLGDKNAEIQFFLGSIAIGKNQVPEAIAHLQKYVAAQPTNTQNLQTAQALLAYLTTKK